MKKLLYVVAGVIGVVVIAIVALVTLVNPNQFKPLISEQAQAATGLTVNIDGDISWRFFPSLGLTVEGLSVDNPTGFDAQHMLNVDSVEVGVAVMPLFDRHLLVETAQLVNAKIAIQTLSDGSSNLDVFSSQQTAPATSEQSVSQPHSSPSATEPEQAPWTISVEGVAITDGQVRFDDAQAGTSLLLEQVNLTLNQFDFETWSELTLSAKGVHNQQQFSADLSTQLWIDTALVNPQLQDLTVNATYNDPSVSVSKLTLNLDKFSAQQWSNVVVETALNSAGQEIEAKLALEAQLSQDFTQYQLRNIGLESTVSGEAITLSTFNVAIPSFNFGEANLIEVNMVGSASGVNFDQQLSGQFWIDQAISAFKLDNAKLRASLSGEALPYTPMAMGWDGVVNYDINASDASVVIEPLTIDELTFTGNIAANLSGSVPVITYLLKSPNVDVDALLAKMDSGAESATQSDSNTGSAPTATGGVQAAQSEPDLSALNSIALAGQTQFKRFKASNLVMTDFNTDVQVANGVAEVRKMSAKLYQGSLNLNAKLDGSKALPSYSGKVKLNKVQAKPLLVALADTDLLEGQATANIDFNGQSLIPDLLMQNLQGLAKVSFSDGAINGINVAQIIRDNYAKLKGQGSNYQSEVKKTDFSALKGSFKFDKGNVTTNDFAMQSPLLRVTAQGGANYLAETVDALTKVSIVGTLEGQGGEGINDLKDLTLPLTIKGPWASPKFGIDFTALQQQELERNKKKLEEKAKKEAERGLKKLLGDKASDEETKKLSEKLLKGLFN